MPNVSFMVYFWSSEVCHYIYLTVVHVEHVDWEWGRICVLNVLVSMKE